jgi:hypothetical protein
MPAPPRGRTDVSSVVIDLRRRHPRAGADRLAQLLADDLADDRELLLDVARFVVEKTTATAATRERMSRAAPSPRQRVERQAAEKAEVAKVAAKVKAALVLDWVVPGTGKALRYVLGREVAALGEGFAKIAARVPPDVMCGECLTEGETRILLLGDGAKT